MHISPLPRQDGNLTEKNCTVAIVGKDLPFTILEEESLQPYIATLRDAEDAAPAPAAGGGETETGAVGEAPMET